MSRDQGEAQLQQEKHRLVKASRMYAMCQKAGFDDPSLAVSLALDAFEEMWLAEASEFIQKNRSSMENMAWAFTHSETPKEFEERLRERTQRSPGG